MKRYHYFVEGECEKKLLKSFMYVDSDSFIEGKVEVFNFVNERISLAKARTIKKNTTVVIVTDTDVKNIDVLEPQWLKDDLLEIADELKQKYGA